MHFHKTFLSGGLRPSCKHSCIILLLKAAFVVLNLSSVTSHLNFVGICHECSSFLLLASEVCFAFKLNLLHLRSLLELETLSQLRNRHFLHKAVATCLRWIKSFRPLDRNLFELTYLPDKLNSLGMLRSLLILALLQGFLYITMNFISYGLVILLL